MRRTNPRVVFGLVVMLSACGSRGLELGPTVPTLVQLGASQRAVLTVTDLDAVRDIAATATTVYVATDRGLLVYPAHGEPTPRRFTRAEGLPDDDVRAVVATSTGAIIACASGLVALTDAALTPLAPAPPVGVLRGLRAEERGLVACGSTGLARWAEGAWSGLGEAAPCEAIFGGVGGAFWAAVRNGLWRIEGGEIVREHSTARGLPAPRVWDLVELDRGVVLALLASPSGTVLGHFDGRRWFSYTVPELDRPVAGLVRDGARVLLVTPGQAFVVGPSLEEGLALVPLTRSDRELVRSYRARITPAAEIPAAPPAPELPGVRATLVPVPDNHPTIDAPPLYLRADPMRLADDPVLVRSDAERMFLADRNRGVEEHRFDDGVVRALRSRDLVAPEDLQIATGRDRAPWIRATSGDVGRWDGRGFVRVPTPEGVVPGSIATGPDGLYLVAHVPDAPVVRVYRAADAGWTLVVERTLALDAPLVGLPLLGVDEGGAFWIGLRVGAEGGARARGVVVLDPRAERVVFHRRGADPTRDGEGALSMPDEVAAIDLGQAGYAWFPTLSGAVRVGNHQAVVFGEARGVRGEIVSDVAVGAGDRVWVAAAEGVGFYENQRFDFRLPAAVRAARPTALAVGADGDVWGAGAHGVVFLEGGTWRAVGEAEGLPTTDLVDVEIDGAGTVWLLARDRVLGFRRLPAARDE